MKTPLNLMLLSLLLAFASCNLTSNTFDNPDKDKLLLQVISYVLEEGHVDPKDFDDQFSEHVFERYIEQIDPYKTYFYASDLEQFNAYRYELDDELRAYELNFFNTSVEVLTKRLQEAKSFYKKILAKPFDYKIIEEYSSDAESESYPADKKEMENRWRKQLKLYSLVNYNDLIRENQTAENKKSDVELEIAAREETMKSMDELFDFIDDRERRDWFDTYINALVEEFDPHTYYLSPDTKDRFDTDMSGNFEGIGARLQKRMDNISVNEIISGGPAWRQNKLEVGDVILKVRQADEKEAVSVVGMRIDEAVKLIKGPKGTNVILTLKKVDGNVSDLEITRDIVELEEVYVKSSVVEKDGSRYGLIDLPKFYVDFDNYKERNAASDVKREIERLKAEGVEGIIIDLRGNGGGSLPTVVEMTGLFIEKGPVVQVRSTGSKPEQKKDTDSSITWDGPLVVMVNEMSASASEIFAAAIQDYKRGIIIGSPQTYGKGTVQNVFDLNRMVRNNDLGDLGALAFTTQKFYRINGGSTQLKGVNSDIVIPDRYSFIDVGERDLENPLPWDQITPADYTIWNGGLDYDYVVSSSKQRIENNALFQLIEENAKWIKESRDDSSTPLNYDLYKKELDRNETEVKRFDQLSDYENQLQFASLPYELEAISKDSILKEKRSRWHDNLRKDLYVEEALNVLTDLRVSQNISKKSLTSIKN